MKLLNTLLFFLFFISNTSGFLLHKPKVTTKISTIKYDNQDNNNIIDSAKPFTPLQKVSAFFKLIRPSNILPTTLLTFTGGWIVNPHLFELLNTPSFIVGIFDTLLIMSTSMILNDLFDIPLDKINNPRRPLITGEVKVEEAIALSSILLGLTEYLNFMYLPSNLQIVIHTAIANILIYTPILKKIPFIKNLSCAGLVAFSVFFAGLTANPIIDFGFNKNWGLLAINSQLIFFGSLYTEILLDMCDIDGDKQNGILTLPVIYGKNMAFEIANSIAYFNILLCFTELSIIYNFKAGLLLLLIYSPLLYYLKETKRLGFTKENINKTLKNTIPPLFMTLLYFCNIVFF
jgi:geranylgeranylglycerol-phosphate geranylgeranyltransferase